MAVKDIFDVAGYPTAAGNAFELAASGIKTQTAATVQCLLDAGARFVGKTHTDELAYSLLGRNIHFGSPASARFPGIIAGGSSTGSALAVAEGFADIGMGTDTSGSIRLPAALNGCIGWRPTHGLLSLSGCRAVAPSFDTVGLIVRRLDVLDRAMAALGVTNNGVALVRMVLPEELLDACEGDVGRDFVAAIGHRATPVRLLGGLRLSELSEAFQTILWHEAAASNARLLESGPGSIDPQIRLRLERGRHVPASQLAEARQLKAYLSDRLALRLGTRDVAIFPSLPVLPPRVDATPDEFDRFRQRAIALTCLAGLAGLPQLVLPHDDVAPTSSISLLSTSGTDRQLLDFARRLPTFVQEPT
ncbi:amidase family protein [Devosia sp. SL43]|uniref:amidase family protein n=1 Tax=Devosia sp. SL43 TaxID=2806348 RepID=UPI001EECFE47|nr:amidase family protein [Devosia sp. SL43]UJW84872.1 amidase [Devosia sp. SL43]